MDHLHHYGKIFTLGHRSIASLFDGDVIVQEKIDGSQFNFGLFGGELLVRSKGAEIHGVDGGGKLFKGAVETAMRLADKGLLMEGWQYRGEAMHAPKHNSLTYGRAPAGNVILFDVDTGLESRVSDPAELLAIACELGLEVVPTLHRGPVEDMDALKAFLERESILGLAKIEGIVIKNYSRWGEDGKMLMGKLVSEAFKEQHRKEWPKANPGRADILEQVKQRYRSERRWEKAIQHRAEAGELQNAPQDIGPLLKEIVADVEAECRHEIADILFAAFWPEIKRGLTAGFVDWYRGRLLAQQQFATSEPAA